MYPISIQRKSDIVNSFGERAQEWRDIRRIYHSGELLTEEHWEVLQNWLRIRGALREELISTYEVSETDVNSMEFGNDFFGPEQLAYWGKERESNPQRTFR